MADNTQIEVQLVKDEFIAPAPDDLIAGNLGAVYTDLVKITTEGEYKRGTLLMSNGENYVNATKDGINTAAGICILCDNVVIGDGEFAEVPAYFEGEFSDARVIFPFEGDDENHDTIVEEVRDALRKHKIFLRNLHK